jgi:hypothetical protein
VHLAADLHGVQPLLPTGAEMTQHGGNWLRYRTADPTWVNPTVVQKLMEQGLGVVALQERPRNLEQVYLQAIQAPTVDQSVP